MVEHVIEAIRQLRQSPQIGRRGTEVISFWPMKPKWEKYGNKPFTVTGTDGESLVEDRKLVIPAIMRLVYFRAHDGRMCQLAYVLESEKQYPLGYEDQAHWRRYLDARGVMPKYVDGDNPEHIKKYEDLTRKLSLS